MKPILSWFGAVMVLGPVLVWGMAWLLPRVSSWHVHGGYADFAGVVVEPTLPGVILVAMGGILLVVGQSGRDENGANG